MKPILVGIGEILWDIFPSRNESANKTFGGATTNFAYHAPAPEPRLKYLRNYS